MTRSELWGPSAARWRSVFAWRDLQCLRGTVTVRFRRGRMFSHTNFVLTGYGEQKQILIGFPACNNY